MRAVIDDDRVSCATLRALQARWVRLNARRHADGRYDAVAAGEQHIADLAALCAQAEGKKEERI